MIIGTVAQPGRAASLSINELQVAGSNPAGPFRPQAENNIKGGI